MKIHFIIIISLCCFTCQFKPNLVDQHLKQETLQLKKTVQNHYDQKLMRFYKKTYDRGEQEIEVKLQEELLDLQKIVHKIIKKTKKDSIVYYHQQYIKLLPKLKSSYCQTSGLDSTQNNDETLLFSVENYQQDYQNLITHFSQKRLEYFKDKLFINFMTIIDNSYTIVSAPCCFCFTIPKVHNNQIAYHDGDTLISQIIFPYYDQPAAKKIQIDGMKTLPYFIHSKSYIYSRMPVEVSKKIIDSAQTEEITVNFSYKKSLYKDTTFSITRKIEIE